VEASVESTIRILGPKFSEPQVEETPVQVVLERLERRDGVFECRMSDVNLV